MIYAFALACQFLTRLPIPLRGSPQAEDWGRSVFFFPWVGMVIGLIMAGFYAIFAGLDSHMLAVLLLIVWVLLTGGLHLDGLADTADAWVGGIGDRDRTLAIMKDSSSGPIGVVAVVLVLLAKYASLTVVVNQEAWELLIGIPILGRAAILLMLLTTPYVRAQGLGAKHAEYLSHSSCIYLLCFIAMLIMLTLHWNGVTLLLVLGIGFVLLRRGFINRIGGSSGDTLGATCELTEVITLMALVLLVI